MPPLLPALGEFDRGCAAATCSIAGGRFEDWPQGWKDDKMGRPYGALLNLYQEKTAGTIHSGTGERHKGVAAYVPVVDYLGGDLDDRRPADGLHRITHRVISQTKSRTIADPWLRALLPENGILVNPRDAERLGLEDGRQVRVVSATNPAGEWDLGGDRRKAMVARSSSLLEEHQEQPADAVRIAVRNGKRRRRDGRPSG